MPELTVISLGWGVQSFTLAAMSALGALPRVDAAIHADTTHERSATYAFAAEMSGWLHDHGVKVVMVQAADTDQVGELIPAYTLAPKGQAEQTEGQVRRQCTSHWKVTPMRQWVSATVQARGWAKTPGLVEQWLGISMDEWRRAKTSDVAYITHRFPLLEQRMTRADCVAWLQAHDLPVPHKSACTFCPYQNRRTWGELKRDGGADWAHAVAMDTEARNKRGGAPIFVHPKRVPLGEAVVIPEDQGLTQPGLFPAETEDTPCDSGYCFL